MVGLLLVRGGVHIVAYARALEKLTGADVGKLLPIPDVSNKKFPKAAVHEEKGFIESCIAGVRKTMVNWAKFGMDCTPKMAKSSSLKLRLQKVRRGLSSRKSLNSHPLARSIQT